MATQNYNINVNTTQAVGSMQKLQSSTDRIRGAFSGLGTAIGALAFGSLIRNAVGFAAAVNDMSSATNVSRQSILGLGQALTTNGGQASKATDAVQRFSLSLGQAAEGSQSTQAAFASVGISLDNLSRLDESEILARTIEGLGRITDSGRRAAIQAQIFGKTMAGVNAAGLARNFRNLASEQDRNADAIRRAGEAQDKLNAAMNRFQVSVIKTIQPMVDAFNRLSDDQIQKFIESLVKVGAAAVAFTALSAAVQGLIKVAALLGGVFVLANSGILKVAAGATGAVAAFKSITKTATITVSVLSKFAIPAAWTAIRRGSGLAAELALTFVTLGKRISFATAAFGGLGGAAAAMTLGLGQLALSVAAVGAAVVGINELIKLAFSVDPIDIMAAKLESLMRDTFPRVAAGLDRIGAALGMATAPSKQVAGQAQAQDTTQTQQNTAVQQSAADAQRLVTSAIAAKTLELQKQTRAFQQSNSEIVDAINIENQLIGKSSEYSEVVRAQEALLKRSSDAIQNLKDAKEALSDADKRLGLGDVYDQQIAKIQQLTAVESERIARVISNSSRLQAAESLRQFGLSREIDLQQQLNDVVEQTARIGLTELENKYRDISAAARESARAAIAAEAARRGLDTLPMVDQEEYYRRAARGMDRLRAATKKLHDQSRTFGAGWRKAFNEYVDAATNAAAKAERIFSKFVNGIEDALVDFAKTGKLNWRQFVADMAEELLRSQIRETLASLGQALGLGNLFGGAGKGSTPGSSASNPMYVTMVGSGGAAGTGGGDVLGNFISKLGGGGGSAPAVTSGGGIGGGGSPLGNILNIGKSLLGSGGNLLSTIGSGIKNIFGGFFANGGRIPGGKFGIVGERGPEFIGGPANITPMGGGGSTNVTYNINAVDAASFKSMIAADPSFIYAVTEQGRRGVPARR